MSMVEILAVMPEVRYRALVEHVPDAHGRCWACRTSAGVTAAWPCAARRIAEEAELKAAQDRDRETEYGRNRVRLELMGGHVAAQPHPAAVSCNSDDLAVPHPRRPGRLNGRDGRVKP